MRYAFQIKVNFRGGIVSPGNLLHILEALQLASVECVRFGLRQQLLIDATHKNYDKLIAALNDYDIAYEVNKDEYPNLVSSYAAEEIFIHDSWLKEGTYKDIFDLIDYEPQLKLNLSDSHQTFSPFFSGHINWIASKSPQYWYLYIRFPKTKTMYQWPMLVYTNDVIRVSKKVEATILANKQAFYDNDKAEGQALFELVVKDLTTICKPIDEPLQLPHFNLPYYEGFNSYGNKTWLGIYKRDELFSVDFLRDIATACLQTKVGQLYTTPWKSIIIKNIEKQDRPLWDNILGKYRINVRHSANELAWQVEDNNEDGLGIKRHIIREFDKQDVRTFGLCFGVNTQPESNMFGSVIVQRQFASIRGQLKALDKFDILYTKNFNPNSYDYVVFRNDIPKDYLDTYLISLIKHYYEVQKEDAIAVDEAFATQQVISDGVKEQVVQQCSICLTVYDATMGDEALLIQPNTAFEHLPETYCCPLCEAPKSAFRNVTANSLFLQVG
jgi:rubredoxin